MTLHLLLALPALADPFRPTQLVVGGWTATDISVVPVDIDGDGVDELASEWGDDEILLWEPTGDGFAPTVTLATQSFPSLMVADLDGDGLDDILTGSRLHAGGAGFAVTATFGAAVKGEPGDVDGDGDLDVLGRDGSWFENRSSGASFTATPFGTAHDPDGPVPGDLDGDGDLDFYSTWDVQAGGNGMAWWENDGTGFGWTEHAVADATFGDAYALADTDRDGDLDVIGARDGLAVSVMPNDPSEADHFDAPVTFAVPDSYVWAVEAVPVGDSVWVAVQDMSGTTFYDVSGVAPTTVVPLGHGKPKWFELDGDGVPDLLLGERTLVTAWSGFPDAPVERVLAASATGYPELSHGDLDGDLDPDLLAISDGSIAWHENVDGHGATWAAHDIDATRSASRGHGPDRLHDVDGDGDLDVLAWWGANEVVLWSNDGAGASFTRSTLFTAPYVADLSAGDIDGDDDTDVVVATTSPDEVAIWRAGPGGFVRTVLATSATDWTGVTVADVDLDGDADVVADDGNTLRWYENRTGAGTLWTAGTIGTGWDADELVLADLDLDGDLDVVTDAVGDHFGCYEQTSPLSFSRRTVGGIGGTGVALADVDLDGDADVLTVDVSDGSLLFRNDAPSSGIPAFVEETVAPYDGAAIHAFDVDGDGDPDAIVVDAAVGEATVYRNEEAVVPDDDEDSDGLFGAADRCPTDFDPLPTDADGDGVPRACDCDDDDPAVFPGALDVCNGADDDCDGLEDEDSDADADLVTTCGPDGSPGTPDDDCDDLDPEVLPGAAELCDGIDGDCDGTAEPDLDLDLVCDADDVCPGADDALDADADGVPDGCDLALAVLGPARPGQQVTLRVVRAAPGEVVRFYWSRGGTAPGPCPATLGGHCLELGAPIASAGTLAADASGVAAVPFVVAAGAAAGTRITFQAAVARGPGGADSDLTAPVVRIVQP